MSGPRARGVTIFSTYLVQGLAAGFSLTALANHLAGLGLSTVEIGRHFALVGLPWALQPVLWGPLVDRAPDFAMGRRRALALAAVLGALVALAGLLLVPDYRALAVVSGVFLVHSVFASLLDTALDRMVLDHVPADELGRASALTRAGMVVGTAISASLFAWLLGAAGFRVSVAVLVALSAVATAPLLVVRERAGDALLSARRRGSARGAVPGRGAYLAGLVANLRRPEAALLLALCFALEFTTTAFDVRLGVALVQGGGWDAASLSHLQGLLGLASGTLGAALVGWWSDRAGAGPALRALFAACAAAYLASAALVVLAPGAGGVVLALSNVVPALLYVALVPTVMRLSAGAAAATGFEVYMAVLNLGDVAGAAASGALDGALPPAGGALLAAGVFVAGTLLLSRRVPRLA